jgi:hypothetical protein
MTTERFITRATQQHKGKYDYTKTKYLTATKPVTFDCPIHGEIKQLPYAHLQTGGCTYCGREQRGRRDRKYHTIEEIADRGKSIHNNQYRYPQQVVASVLTPITVICPYHGSFKQAPYWHLKGSGCPKCSTLARGKKRRLTTNEFITRAKLIHGDRYNYTETQYITQQTPVKILCKLHGYFETRPNNHLFGKNCPQCKASKLEALIGKFLTKLGITYLRNKRFSKCRGKKPLAFDTIFSKEVCQLY